MPEAHALKPAFAEAAALGDVLAGWAASLRYEDLPAPVVAQAKRLLLDALAVAWAGSGADGIEPVRTMVMAQGGAPESSVWAFGDRLPATQAAFINGAMAAALDFDSVHDEAGAHSDIVVIPAVLALAERGRLAGREFIAAYAVGSEIMVRLTLAVRSHPGWFYSSVLGVFAAALAAARALRLDARGVRHAMGIALSRAAGTQQTLVERSLTKRLQTAFASRDGVEAGLLAACGVTAPAQVFEGQAGFEALYTKLDAAQALSGLGQDYRFTSLTLKKHASCFCNHAAIEAALELVRRHALRAADVRDASVRLSPYMARLVGAPFVPGENPQVAAQFSVQYSVASVLQRGRFCVDDIFSAAAQDREVGELAARIRVEVDASNAGKFVPATVTVRMRAGGEFSATVNQLPGTPASPMADAELRDKALSCFGSGARPLSAHAAGQLMAKIARIETLSDMNELWKG